jgi:hypothetical protein
LWRSWPRQFALSRQKIQLYRGPEKGPGGNRAPLPLATASALLVALVHILLTGFAGLLTRLAMLTVLVRFAMLVLLARLTLLLAGLLARLRLVLVALLLIALARLVLVRHVLKLRDGVTPAIFLNPRSAPSFHRKATVPKVSWYDSANGQEPRMPVLRAQN